MGRSLTFSVGIPAFNQAEFLEETILSLLNQTRAPDEIVISDHYSTDRTPEIIHKYAAQYPELIRGVMPPRDANLTGQYNFTLESQTSDWITLLSSDDVARRNFCRVLTQAAARNRDAVLVRAGWENIDHSGSVVGKNYLLSVSKLVHPPNNLVSQRNGPKVSFAAFAVKRDAYAASGPILASIESLGDWALFLQVAPFGPFIYENEIISGYRVGHDGNKFRKRIGMWVRDEQRMFYEVMPLAAARARMVDTAWIARASRENFIRYLAAASREFNHDERAGIVPHFEAWATRVGGEPELRVFASGGTVVVPISLLKRGKRLIRPFVQQSYSRLKSW